MNPEHCGKHGKLHSLINHYTKQAFVFMVRHALYPPAGCHNPSSFLFRNVRRVESCAILGWPIVLPSAVKYSLGNAYIYGSRNKPVKAYITMNSTQIHFIEQTTTEWGVREDTKHGWYFVMD